MDICLLFICSHKFSVWSWKTKIVPNAILGSSSVKRSLGWAYIPQAIITPQNVIHLCMYRLDMSLSQCSRSYHCCCDSIILYAQPYWLLNPACAFIHRLSKLYVMDIVKYNQRNLSRDMLHSSLHLWFSKGYGHRRKTSRERDLETKTSQVEQG